MSSDPALALLVRHPAPWTAWYVRDEEQYHLLDSRGATICPVKDKADARGIARLLNYVARQRTAEAPSAQVIVLGTRETVPAPPAPNPRDGSATTWDQLLDHLIYLLDDGQHDLLRQRLFDYARMTVGLRLPPVFVTAPDQGSGA